MYAALRAEMFNQLDSCITDVKIIPKEELCALLLYGHSDLDSAVNTLVFIIAQNYIISSDRFLIPG